MKTILMIKGSEDYAAYEQQKIAQHKPSGKPSMREEISEIKAMMMQLLELSRENRLV